MLNPLTPIQYSDLAALATLANTKLAPGTPYLFPPVAGKDTISLPLAITATPPLSATTVTKTTLYLFGYKTIAGVKTYTQAPFVIAGGDTPLTFNWAPDILPTVADGYLAVIPPVPDKDTPTDTFPLYWKDIGLVNTLAIPDLSFAGWTFDETVAPYANVGPGLGDTPCAHGIWGRVINMIHHDLFHKLDLFGGATPFTPSMLLSGPWAVSVAPKCYFTLNGVSIYKNIAFIYSPSDSATGNDISRESDLSTYFSATNDTNTFNWDTNGVINGTIVLMSVPREQNAADWTLSASDPSITATFNGEYDDPDNGIVSAMIFTFKDTPYVMGTPITITAHPTGGGNIIAGPFGGFASLTFTENETTMIQTDYANPVIHYAGSTAKSVALANTLSPITMTTGTGGSFPGASHWRVFCNGVFMANTLPTPGMFTYVDVDLPQYNPQPVTQSPDASSRRVLLNANTDLAPTPHMDNRGALWTSFRDTDFTPDNVNGMAFLGSKAWNTSIYSKNVLHASQSVLIPSNPLDLYPIPEQFFPQQDAVQIRILVKDPNLQMYLRVGAPPTFATFDAIFPGGAWALIDNTAPYWDTSSTWYVGFFNPSLGTIGSQFFEVEIDGALTAPNGTFFPNASNILSPAEPFPQLEGFTYSFSNLSGTGAFNFPIPAFGYTVYSITVRRQPVDNGSGILIAPTTGTSDLTVNVGTMPGFGFDSAGTFNNMLTVTIPAGQASVTISVTWPVLGGTPLAYQCDEVVFLRAAVNFQPQMHSTFDLRNQSVIDPTYNTGSYSNQPYFNADYGGLTFLEGFISAGGSSSD